jgi:hypothetical protein
MCGVVAFETGASEGPTRLTRDDLARMSPAGFVQAKKDGPRNHLLEGR